MPAKVRPSATQSRGPTGSPRSGPERRATKIGAVAVSVAASATPIRLDPSAKNEPMAAMVP